MKIKRYVAQNLHYAIQLVKAEMGEDAIILDTKRRKKGGFLGLFGQEVVEVTAGLPEAPPPRPRPVPLRAPLPGEKKEEARLAEVPSLPLATQERAVLNEVRKELDEIKKMVAGLARTAGGEREGDLFATYRLLADFNNRLVENEVTAENAAALVEKVIAALPEEDLHDYQQIKECLEKIIAADLAVISPLDGSEQQVLALVGPTGVGKTTTIAKLAAKYALLENRQVALITADTYRIAAVEQLRRYAEILDVPLEVVLEGKELERALERHRDKNLILIDTAGRSQHNIVQLSELRNILSPSVQMKTVLVLSMTTKHRDLLDIAEKFRRVNYDALLFTKLDETTSYGSIFNIAKATGKPLTYVTTGQNVPDDIEVAEPETIAKLILGEH
ncbi:MAG TPA: flagellar biosynthesis protein FlhF [Firmicutes bacterium]|nr:flagellar biosynthesis protein FlhF [Bacillota bacterium]